ncbi:D-alanine--D-alanine ligase [Candidatus Latescibacterota bacterium]
MPDRGRIMNIAVFMGGSSPEREVSLSSGTSISKALKDAGHNVTSYDVTWEGSATLFDAVEEISHNDTDIVFLALHGGLGENGGIQGVLDAAGVAYTGSGVTASAVAMDKDISKLLFTAHDIPTAAWITGTGESIDTDRVETEIGYPCVVKPVDLGSTIGLTLVRDRTMLEEGIRLASNYSGKIMVENYIGGKELSVPVLIDKPLPVIEIRPSKEIYDYECKYSYGMSEYFVPAQISKDLAHEVTAYAMKVFNILGLNDIARIDFRLDADEQPLCFEANTLPGMTSTSLVPKSAARDGIDFLELVSFIAENAYKRKG